VGELNKQEFDELVESYICGNIAHTRKKLKNYTRKELLTFIIFLGDSYQDRIKAIKEVFNLV